MLLLLLLLLPLLWLPSNLVKIGRKHVSSGLQTFQSTTPNFDLHQTPQEQRMYSQKRQSGNQASNRSKSCKTRAHKSQRYVFSEHCCRNRNFHRFQAIETCKKHVETNQTGFRQILQSCSAVLSFWSRGLRCVERFWGNFL